MHRKANFRMLIFIITYVWCSVEIACNNESTKAEINPPDAGRTTPNFNTNNSIVSGEVYSNINKTKPVFLEGGSMVSVSAEKNKDSSTSRTSIQTDTLNEKILQYDVQYGLNDTSSTDRKPHKGRKGVDALKETSSEENPAEHSVEAVPKTTESGEKSTHATNGSPETSTNINSAVNLTTNVTLSNSKNSSQENSSQSAPVVNATSNSTASLNSRNATQNSTNTENKLNATELTQPPKPKPEFTRDDSDVDDNSSYSLTNPENDYVIPVVATIFAAPLLIVLAMFLYKRSKEFWERRHYRRMDFLIDGMYND